MIRDSLVTERRSRRWAALAAASVAMLLAVSTGAAHADEVGTEFDFVFSGNVQHNGAPVPDAVVLVEGGAYSAEVPTDTDGRWRVGVPDKGVYLITLLTESLPPGMEAPADPDGRYFLTDNGAMFRGEFGLTQNRTVNLFLTDASGSNWLLEVLTSPWVTVTSLAILMLGVGLVVGLLWGRRKNGAHGVPAGEPSTR